MKLGTETGSLTNHIYSRMVIGQPEPTEGMGATILCWTDRHAATITEIYSVGAGQLVVTAQEDTATRTSGSTQDGSAEYAYAQNPNGRKHSFRRSKSGAWQAVTYNAATGRWNKSEGPGLRIGDRNEYRDPSF